MPAPARSATALAAARHPYRTAARTTARSRTRKGGRKGGSRKTALRDHSSLSLASIEATGELAVLVANASDLMVGPDRLIANARFEQCVVTPVLAYCPDPTVLRRAAVWVWTSLDAVECTDWAGVLACYQSTPARPDLPALVCAEIGAASD